MLAKNRNALTVRELIEELEGLDPDAHVVFAYGSNDHWRTTVAEEVIGVEEGDVTWNTYHRLWEPADDSDEEIVVEVEDDVRSAVIIRGGGRR